MNFAPAKAGAGPPTAVHALLDKVRDGLGIAEAMRMMGVAFLDHHRDASAELLIDGLDGGSILPKIGSMVPQTCSTGTSARARSPSL